MDKDNKRLLKLILIISLSLNTLTAGFFISKRIYYSNVIFFYKHFGKKVHGKNVSIITWENYLRSKPDTGDIIFSGTSITQAFPLHQAFNNTHLVNLGFAYNTTRYTLSQARLYSKRQPQKIFLEVGVNDFRNGQSVNTAFNNFVGICAIIKAQSPRTKLYVQSVLPINLVNVNKSIRQYNNQIAMYCSLNHITYIELYTHFVNEEKIDNSLTIDGVHLNTAGYFLWRKLLKPYIDN